MNDDPLSDTPAKADDITVYSDELDSVVSFPIVGVGASAGGLEAFTQLLRALPADTGMAFVLVQHLAPSHPSALAEILGRATKMPVMEVRDEPEVEPNHVYVIPPDRSMIISRGALHLMPRELRRAPHPVDQFFRSLAQEQRHQAIGVVLSGTATDGTIGLEEIKAEGGITFAQDVTAQHEGMPHSAIASGCVDFVLPPSEIAREIIRIGQHPYTVPAILVGHEDEKSVLAKIVQVIQHTMGVDFSGYKFNTLYRRVTRRMVFQKMDGLSDYLKFLRETPAEAEALYQDILISVTSFFRDTESFDAIKTTAFPRMLKHRSRHDPVRLWTLGCSTGQEAYSIAMAYTEAAEAAGSSVPFQLFASDLNAKGIEKARVGMYPKDINQDVSPERLRRFFTEVDGHYRITKSIRDACVFSRHNVLADPPFSRIDMISCRNLLIYMEPELQKRIMPNLHYALKPTGCLWLGGSETIGSYRNLFETEDAKHKIYSKKLGSTTVPVGISQRPSVMLRVPYVPIMPRPNDSADLLKEADRILLTKFAPPGVLVNAELDILQYRGDTSRFLAPVPGKASLNLLKMLREGLLVAVRAACVRAAKDGVAVREVGLRIKSDTGFREVAIEAIPLKKPTARDGGFLIVFEESESANRTTPAMPEPLATDADNDRLQQDLIETREYLQTVIEQQEVANEELQSANEEVQSANEELQSTNEELETSKEEIQSSNEELATVNDELNNRNGELHRVNNDLVNVLGSVQMPIIILGPDFRIRRYTPSAEKLLNLIPNDVGRPLADIKLHLEELPELEPLLAEVTETVTPRECEVRDRHGRWYSLRLRPYRTLDNKIDGVVMMIVDVDVMKRALAYATSVIKSLREPMLVLDGELRVRTASDSFYRNYQVSTAETENRYLYELGNGQWNIPGLRRLLEDIPSQDSRFENYQVDHTFEHIGRKTMSLSANRFQPPGESFPSILLAIEDITERNRDADRLRDSEAAVRFSRQQLQTIYNVTPVGMCLLDADLRFVRVNECLARMNGMPAAQHIGKTVREIIPGLADKMEPVLRRILETGETVFDIEITGQTAAQPGVDRTWLESWYPQRDVDGQVVGVNVVAVDITSRKRAEQDQRESEERYRTVVKQVEDYAIFRTDVEGMATTWNEGVNRVLGFDEGDFVGKDIVPAIFLPEDVKSGVANRELEEAAATGKASNDRWMQRKGGIRFYAMGTTTALRDSAGELIGFTKVMRDQTDRKLLEDELRQYSAELSEADRHKTEFLAMLAHELRNPLAPIRNAVQVLRRIGGTSEAVASVSEMMERQVGQMIRLVDDLLDASRISRGKIELRRGHFELGSVMNQAVEAARPWCESRELELIVTLPAEPIYLNADATRVAQIVGNLLNNACKFTDNGGRLSVIVEREGDQAVIRVRDNGIGIAPDRLPRIFDMFMQVDTSLERTVSGLGIGLTLVKSLVEMHDGTLEAHSEGLGKGSEFVVCLPILVESAETPAEPSVVELAPTASKRILVVDDNRDSATTMAMLLDLGGNETLTAFDGLEAYEAAEAFKPEVVLLDIGLPKLNGFEVARKIRKQPWGRDILLVALTGWGQDEDRQKTKDAGFNSHLVKPVDHSVLMKLLAEL